MVKREVYYFEDFGKHNAEQTIEAAKKVALSLDLKYVVVASASGVTGVKTAEAFKDTGNHRHAEEEEVLVNQTLGPLQKFRIGHSLHLPRAQ